MTNQEAIKILSHQLWLTNSSIELIKDGNKFCGSLEENEEWASCLDLAIKALNTMDFVEDMSNEISRLKAEQRPKGKWIEKQETPASVSYYCSNCECAGLGVENFCSWCGAELVRENKE